MRATNAAVLNILQEQLDLLRQAAERIERIEEQLPSYYSFAWGRQRMATAAMPRKPTAGR
jgi:hypothetical protein